MVRTSKRTPRTRPAQVDPASDGPTPALGSSDNLTPERPVIVVHGLREHDSTMLAEMHLSMEVGLVLSGAMERDHGKGWFWVRTGQAWACAAFEPHRYRAVGRGARRLIFHFLPSLLAQLPSLEGFDPTAVFRSHARFGAIGSRRRFRQRLAALGEELAARHPDLSVTRPGPAWIDLLRTLEMIGAEVGDDAGSPSEPPQDVVTAVRIQRAVELIAGAPERSISVREAATVCRMADSTFRRHFRQVTGLSFYQFQLRHRLARTASALRYSNWQIKAIASAYGFRDASHLHHTFAAHYGMGPAEYRAAVAGQ